MREWKVFGSFAVNFLGTSPNIIPMYAEEKNMEKKASLICSYILDVGNFIYKYGNQNGGSSIICKNNKKSCT